MAGDLPLLERSGELSATEAAATEAHRGSGRFVVIEGPAGIGKTRLLAHLRQPPDGSLVLGARGSDLETPFAFGIVRQLLEPVLATSTARERDRLFSGAAAQARRVFDRVDLAGKDPAELATLHGLFWLTVNLCRQPVSMLIDDLHWADLASLRFLAYLQARLDAVPLLVAVSVRSGEPSADEDLIGRIISNPDAIVLRPRPLSKAAAATLLAAVLDSTPDEGFVRACYRATAGNPLLLQAVARAAAQDGLAPTERNADRVTDLGPRAVSRFVSQRLATVDSATRSVARAVAVLGPDAGLAAVADLTMLDALTVSEAVAELVRRGMLRADPADPGAVAGFVHPLVAAAVYADIGVRERANAHRQAAETLAAAGSPADQVAAHLLKVPPGADAAVVAQLRLAAAEAVHRGSAQSGFTFLRRCLAEQMDAPQRHAVLTDAAALAIHVDLPAAVPILEEALRSAEDPAEIAWLGLRLGAAHGYLLDPDRAYTAVTAARDRLPSADGDLRRRLDATLLLAPFVAPGRLDVMDRMPALRDLPPHDSVGGRMLEAVVAYHETARADPRGGARARAALRDGGLVRAANGEGPLVSGWLTLIAADDPAGLASLDAAIGQAHRNGSLRALAAAFCFRAMGRLWVGQLAEAERDAREALRLTLTGRVDMDPSFAGAYLAGALIEMGRTVEAEGVLRSLDLPADPETHPQYYALDAWARLRCRQERYGDALNLAFQAGRSWRAFGFINPALGDWRSTAALAAYHVGHADEARAVADEELELARRWGAPRAVGRSLRVLGQIAGGSAGLELLNESVDTLDGTPARLELGASLLELGAAVRRAGARGRAREMLLRALDHAEICGAAPLTARARAELRVAGFRPRRSRLTGADALTPSERRVAEAAAAGATNREIAQALFVTTKTVEVHLSSAYRKLGVHRRRELAERLDSA